MCATCSRSRDSSRRAARRRRSARASSASSRTGRAWSRQPAYRRTDMEHLDDLVAAYRILAEYGVIDAYGHVSLRSPDDPKRYFLARSLAPERVQREDILEYDLDSNPLDARGRESVTERFIHGEIYKSRPDVLAVVHNHSPSVVPFSVTGVPMRALWHMAAFIGDGLPNWEIRSVRKGTDLLVRDSALG